MKTIVAAVDSSQTSEAVIAEAAKIARDTQARVVLVTVVQPPVITNEYAPYFENVAELIAVAEKAAAKRLEHLRGRLTGEGVASEAVQLAGSPVTGILEQATIRQADYIVMGSHGHTAFYDLLVGSTTHGVLLRAPCPVIIVPSKSQTAERRAEPGQR